MIVFLEDRKPFAWLRYYNKVGWVYDGSEKFGEEVKAGLLLPDLNGKPLLLTDSKKRLERWIPGNYDNPYGVLAAVWEDDFDPDSEVRKARRFSAAGEAGNDYSC